MRQPVDLLNQAVEQFNPVSVIVLFSGGNDSIVVADIARKWRADVKLIAIDTGLSADGWKEWTSGFGAEIYANPRQPEWYRDDVIENGFPYTRAAHTLMYRMLKERAIRDVLRREKVGRNRTDTVMFITGVRRHESPERWDAPDIQKVGSAIWVNAIIDFTEDMRNAYQEEHNLPTNPFNQHGLGSGDCQCNWGKFVSLAQLKEHSPQLYERVIKPLDDEAFERHGWHYGEAPSKALKEAMRGQNIMPGFGPFLCAGCERLEANS